MLEANRQAGQKWLGHKREYEALRDKLDTLSDRATHEALVPLGKKAFMMGHLVHTNEIMVLLGDNWFAERSAKQAKVICEKRLKQCDETLQGLTQELDLVDSWRRETRQMTQDAQDGQLEIREPFDEKAEAEWREKHRESQKKVRQQTKSREETVSDEELWKRLDQLEIEEELDAHLEKTAQVASANVPDVQVEVSSPDSSDWSESPPLTDDEEDVDQDSEEETEHGTESPKDRNVIKRRVSFAVSEKNDSKDHDAESVIDTLLNEPICLIEIQHSRSSDKADTPDPMGLPSHDFSPKDVDKLFKKPSILKPFDQSAIQIRSSDEQSEEACAVGNLVIEKVPDTPIVPPNPPRKRVSRFKQSRMAQK
ncbi:hypothetical protein TCAL_11094 [Tigriopus californicus]|uniref:Unconventional prefoldin RPB5 interactor 1 n=2 Tax=Tigriopus californicus TaxID=6832 RepID=A0A553P7Q5_TIGCA|nr:hypothetical protein TCAL_11094 [Tigriopus californicus]|eukprot:TCALIF_11094-PA protein Name:"Similar to URI1 Unconventional prefoldin RPB5 interactor 1 (Homo sapiens)" AED:0.31 eAED:0.34 QI:0/-1/0/1/-1/1/1/0/366